MIVSTLSMMEGNGIAAYIILLALGIIFVVKGGDWFVDAAGFALIPPLVMGKFKRWQGALLLAGYVTYVVLLILNTTGAIKIF